MTASPTNFIRVIKFYMALKMGFKCVDLAKTIGFIILVCTLCVQAKLQAKDIKMYFYQQTPPFEIEEGKGFFYDLVAYIDLKDEKNQYSLHFMPRELINRYIDKKRFKGIVIGANPAWFDDLDKEKYLWSTSLIEDANEIISDLNNPFEYQGPESLIGLTLGGLRGHYYVGLDPLIAEGLVYRDDVSRVTQNMRKATSGRVNAAIINRSFLQYYLRTNTQNFHISSQPHKVHQKQILFSQAYKSNYLIVNEILINAKNNGDLNRLITPYR